MSPRPKKIILAAAVVLAVGACAWALLYFKDSPDHQAGTVVEAKKKELLRLMKSSEDDSARIPIITQAGELGAHLGKRIVIRGTVANTKIPTILGVDVQSDDPDLRGQQAEAEGVLAKSVISQAELDAKIAKIGMFAHRGPGTFYRIVDPCVRVLLERGMCLIECCPESS